MQTSALGIHPGSPNDMTLIPTITHPGSDSDHLHEITSDDRRSNHPTAGRHTIRKWLTAAGNYLGDAAQKKLDLEHSHIDEATRAFPEVPGEGLRNPDLETISRNFDRMREARAGSTYAPSIRPTPDEHQETSPTRLPGRDILEVPKETYQRRDTY